MLGHVENLNTGIEPGRVNQIEHQTRFDFGIFSKDLSYEPNFERFHFQFMSIIWSYLDCIFSNQGPTWNQALVYRKKQSPFQHIERLIVEGTVIDPLTYHILNFTIFAQIKWKPQFNILRLVLPPLDNPNMIKTYWRLYTVV